MKPLIIYLMAICLWLPLNSLGQNKKTDYPTERFSVIEARLNNGKPIVGSVNSGYKGYPKKAKYPWCLKINIALDLKGVTPNGLPLKSESAIANRFEDDLIKTISKYATVHYIGHLYNDSFLDVYLYLDKPELVHQYLQKAVNSKGRVRSFAYEIKQDPDWNTVKPFLK